MAELELVAAIRMVSVLIDDDDDDDDDDDHFLADDANFSLVLSLFSLCRWALQGRSQHCRTRTRTTASSRS